MLNRTGLTRRPKTHWGLLVFIITALMALLPATVLLAETAPSPALTAPAVDTVSAVRGEPTGGHDLNVPHSEAAGGGHGDDSHAGSLHARQVSMNKELPLWSGLPFAGILLSIALFPLLAPHFWEKHYKKISLAWGLVFAIPFLYVYKDLALYSILHIYLIDYIPFIILLWALFTVSGGIRLSGTLSGTPTFNTGMLAIGTILASMMGTTGASMILIRPMLRANRNRKDKTHIFVFFIFLVSNIGGSLTPLGDPPLFLGYLHGVPFFWTLNLWGEYLLMSVILLTVFYFLDTKLYHKPDVVEEIHEAKERLRVHGSHNFLFLVGIIIGILLSGQLKLGSVNIYGVEVYYQNLLRDGIILLMGMLSLWTTQKPIRVANEFTWHPIQEVGFLFAGIFMCIIPMLGMLAASTEGAMAFIVNKVSEPAHFFWAAGSLSSFLDNAPTYLTFFNLALGKLGITEAELTAILKGILDHPHAIQIFHEIEAISLGSVFFGAMTYIGNAPNFMVLSICNEAGVKMPSFFGYMIWSLIFLVPLFALVTWIFLI